MTNNVTSSHEIYRFAVYILRGLTFLCWLCQQLQQLAAHIVLWMDNERERRNRDELDIKVIDLDDFEMYDVDMDDVDMDDVDMDDIDVDDIDVDKDMDDIDMDDFDFN
ncbi:hypothetical protein GGI35DRAFT_329268 [Trichoderma velutinum]